MKFPMGEFTASELLANDKNLNIQTVRAFLSSDAAKDGKSELLRLAKLRDNQFLYSKRVN